MSLWPEERHAAFEAALKANPKGGDGGGEPARWDAIGAALGLSGDDARAYYADVKAVLKRQRQAQAGPTAQPPSVAAVPAAAAVPAGAGPAAATALAAEPAAAVKAAPALVPLPAKKAKAASAKAPRKPAQTAAGGSAGQPAAASPLCAATPEFRPAPAGASAAEVVRGVVARRKGAVVLTLRQNGGGGECTAHRRALVGWSAKALPAVGTAVSWTPATFKGKPSATNVVVLEGGGGAEGQQRAQPKERKKRPERKKGGAAKGGGGGKGAAVKSGAGAGGKASRGSGEALPKPGSWWISIADIDPISLEPISSLPHPPFECLTSLTSSEGVRWFDAQVLAHYLIASGRFFHPISRRELSRAECAKLDAHLLLHKLERKPQVLHAFNHRQETDTGSAQDQALALQREESQAIVQALTQRPGARGGARRSTDATRARRHPPPESGREGEGTGWAIVDDDADAVARADGAEDAARRELRGAGGEVSSSALQRGGLELFPSLGPASKKREPSTMAIVRKAMPPELAASRTVLAAATARSSRDRQLASAFGIRPGAPTAFGVSAAGAYSPETLAVARAHPKLVANIEGAFAELIAGSERRRALPSMPRAHRALVHEVAKSYDIKTGSYGDEPARRVDIFRTPTSGLPAHLLSQVAHSDSSAVAAARGGMHAKEDGHKLEVHFFDVQDRSAVQRALSGYAGGDSIRDNCSLTWAEGARSGAPDAVCVFPSPGGRPLMLELQSKLAGGVRGSFRCAWVDSASESSARYADALLAKKRQGKRPPGFVLAAPAMPNAPELKFETSNGFASLSLGAEA